VETEAVSGSGAARISDVARMAGVGKATVSRVINGRTHVKPATRDRVLEAIRVLNYRPSVTARNLALGRTMVVVVIVPFFTNPSVVERVRGVVDALGRSAYDMMLFDLESEERQHRAFQLLDRSDGLLIVSTRPSEPDVELLRRGSVPCVLVDGRHPSLPSVVIDDVAGGALATQHLIDLGHRRIALIGDTPPEFRFGWNRDRTVGYQQALEAAGLPASRELVREGTRSRHRAARITEDLMRLPDRPTAIFAASDTQALGALEAARELGFRVPDDLSVVGFDDIDIASYAGLTTVRQPLFESGRRGAELLLHALEGHPHPPTVETLPLELVVRGTTAPPPSGTSSRRGRSRRASDA
jgi:DNA-binding LacI/PurR family transcriptional regulator